MIYLALICVAVQHVCGSTSRGIQLTLGALQTFNGSLMEELTNDGEVPVSFYVEAALNNIPMKLLVPSR